MIYKSPGTRSFPVTVQTLSFTDSYPGGSISGLDLPKPVNRSEIY